MVTWVERANVVRTNNSQKGQVVSKKGKGRRKQPHVEFSRRNTHFDLHSPHSTLSAPLSARTHRNKTLPNIFANFHPPPRKRERRKKEDDKKIKNKTPRSNKNNTTPRDNGSMDSTTTQNHSQVIDTNSPSNDSIPPILDSLHSDSFSPPIPPPPLIHSPELHDSCDYVLRNLSDDNSSTYSSDDETFSPTSAPTSDEFSSSSSDSDDPNDHYSTRSIITNIKDFRCEEECEEGGLFDDETDYLNVLANEPWFKKYYLGEEFITLMSTETIRGPIIILIKREHIFERSRKKEFYRVLEISADGEEKYMIPASEVDHNKISTLLVHLSPELEDCEFRKLESDEKFSMDLLDYEHKTSTTKFKFGVLYNKANQKTESEMFGNKEEDTSDDYQQFLTLLGDLVELNGFPNFKGGLDSTHGQTGKHSVYTTWQDNEIMFHVSTLLPFSPNDSQQIEKKRHIGNDIILIVFQDKNVTEPFDPYTVASHFIEVILVVRPLQKRSMGKPIYRVQISTKKGVPEFSPPMPYPSIFKHSEQTRHFLLAKLINAELAAYKGPSFITKLSGSKLALIQELFDKYFELGELIVNQNKNIPAGYQATRPRSEVIRSKRKKNRASYFKKPTKKK